MATEKTINSRIQLKHDTETNWNLAAENSNFIPKIAEPIMYDIDENHPRKRFKIGDGKTNVKDLEFIEQIQSDWNQNDSEADDYIKNRTHWIDKDGVVHLIDEKFIPDAIARTTQIPIALKNPEALTINGISYDGSEAVTIDTPKAFYVTVNDNGDMTGTTDKSYEEIMAAYEAGSPVIVLLQRYTDEPEVLGVAVCSHIMTAFVAQVYDAYGQMWGIYIHSEGCDCVSMPIAADNSDLVLNVLVCEDGNGVVNKTAAEVIEALDAGRNIVCDAEFPDEPGVSYRLQLYSVTEEGQMLQLMYLASFASILRMVQIMVNRYNNNIVAAGTNMQSDIIIDNTTWIGAEPVDFTDTINNMIAAKIPTSLKNPNALTINGVSYDGSKAVTILTPQTYLVELTQDDYGNYSSSIDFLTIRGLLDAGNRIYCLVDGVHVPMVSIGDDDIEFVITVAIGDVLLTFSVDIFNDNSVTVDTIETVALPNPNALTINGVSYDGSEAVNITEQVNAMIDTKIAAIPRWTGGAY